jgi:hypothetical protein
MEIKKSCRTFVGLISTPMQHRASTWKGHRRWLAAPTTAISDSRGSLCAYESTPLTIELLVMAEDAVGVEGNPALACQIDADIGTGDDAIMQFA